MKEVKDIFSKQADSYVNFRPVYPDALYDYLYSITENFDAAWDCGTGNGQVAAELSECFKQVQATDISQNQLDKAPHKDNITYQIARAEDTPFEDNSFDLITVGTALHWFDFDAFYKEVNRVAKNGAHIAAWAYAPFRTNAKIDAILDDFYFNIIHNYWDAERKYVDEEYKTIPFPLKELTPPKLEIKASWTRDHFTGFLNSWSSVQHYINKNGTNPVALIQDRLNEQWPDGVVKEITFPLFIRVGQIVK
jgi:SAM-dependent methyltransferase